MCPAGSGGQSPTDASDAAPTGRAEEAGRRGEAAEFDWRGWALVAAIVVAFFVVPGAILFLPEARSLVRSLGLTLRDAYLILPLVPAFGLGAIAVWSAIRTRSS